LTLITFLDDPITGTNNSTVKIDVYSYRVILYELGTESTPFKGRDIAVPDFFGFIVKQIHVHYFR
jgi:serine/threonine protein kinase